MEYIFFFGLPLFISRAAEKKSKSILLISCFSLEKVQNYTILSHFWSFSLFFWICHYLFPAAPEKSKIRGVFWDNFFLDCHYLFPAGSAKSKKKRYCCAVYLVRTKLVQNKKTKFCLPFVNNFLLFVICYLFKNRLTKT